MARYIDAFVLPVPRKNVAKYRRIALKAAKAWRKHGALLYMECRGDDLRMMSGSTPFPKLARAKPGETVFFSFIVYKSKADRNRINKKVMQDPEIVKAMENPMPFDVKRMAMGGFKAVVDR